MTVVAGIDLGTSGVKVVLMADDETLLASATRRLAVESPHPGWSEQHPDAWWEATAACFDELHATAPAALAAVAGIGLSGQMLGAVLLDAADRPVRPAILWNDQRAQAECRLLAERVPDIGRRTNGAPDPGLTAPKLLWLAAHEPELLDRARWLLLPKDYVRLVLTGERLSEPSDAGGTMLMDCATSSWAADLCDAAGWSLGRLPALRASAAPAGGLRAELARRWGMAAGLPVAAGAGDNMAAALGVGAARPGDGVITVGTSGVVCLVDGAFHPAPESAVLTGPHAAPGTWLSMGVVMSATGTLDWLLTLTGADIAELAPEIDAFLDAGRLDAAPLFVPSLTGIRTPHNRPGASGRIAGIRPTTDRAALAYALFEGVAFQLAQCVEAQRAAGVRADRLALVGGGARSRAWATLIATAVGEALVVPEGAELAAPAGAARLARVAAAGGDLAPLAQPKPVRARVAPEPALAARLAPRRAAFERLLGAAVERES